MTRRRCPIIGLAGGIGSGKTTVSGIFRGLGAVVIDADTIASQALKSPEAAAAIKREFGIDTAGGGQAARRALSEVVFSDRGALDRLNAIIHPAIIAECRRIINEAEKDPHCRAVVLDAPLLFETGMDDMCDAVIFVEADRSVRQRRLAESRGWDTGELDRRQKFQDSLISKRKRADYIISNNGPLDEAAEQAGEIWKAVVDS